MSFPVDSHHFGVKSNTLTMTCEAPHGLAPICLPHLISYPLPYIPATCFPFQPYVKVLFSNWAFVPFLFLIYFIPVSEINRLTGWVLMENVSLCLASLIANGTGPNTLHMLTYVIFNTDSLVPCLRSPASKRQRISPRGYVFYPSPGLSLEKKEWSHHPTFWNNPHLCVMLTCSALTRPRAHG